MRADPLPAQPGPIGTSAPATGAIRAGAVSTDRVRVAGHLLGIRRHGGISFARVQDATGTIQVVADRRVLGADRHRTFDRLSAGDQVEVEGVVMATSRGELSVRVAEFETAANAEGPPQQAPPGAAVEPARSPSLPTPERPYPPPDAAGPAPEGPPPPDLFRPRTPASPSRRAATPGGGTAAARSPGWTPRPGAGAGRAAPTRAARAQRSPADPGPLSAQRPVWTSATPRRPSISSSAISSASHALSAKPKPS